MSVVSIRKEPEELIIYKNSRLVLFCCDVPEKCFETYRDCTDYLKKSYGFAQHAVRTAIPFKIGEIGAKSDLGLLPGPYVLKAFKDIYEYNGEKYASIEDFKRKNYDLRNKKIKIILTF
jgi:hypothetical protein